MSDLFTSIFKNVFLPLYEFKSNGFHITKYDPLIKQALAGLSELFGEVDALLAEAASGGLAGGKLRAAGDSLSTRLQAQIATLAAIFARAKVDDRIEVRKEIVDTQHYAVLARQQQLADAQLLANVTALADKAVADIEAAIG